MDQSTCSVSFCSRPVVLKRDQLCGAHYQQRRAGKPFTEPRATRPQGAIRCAFDGCVNTSAGRGYCHAHLWQDKTHGKMKPLYASQAPKGSSLERDSRGRKHCRGCKEWLSEEEFGPLKTTPDGLRATCGACRRSAWDSEAESDRGRLHRYGLTPERYAEMLSEQGGACAICGTEEPGKRGWQVDHDHSCCPERKTCGKCVRGLLCPSCNHGLGNFIDDVSRLKSAIDYLETTRRIVR